MGQCFVIPLPGEWIIWSVPFELSVTLNTLRLSHQKCSIILLCITVLLMADNCPTHPQYGHTPPLMGPRPLYGTDVFWNVEFTTAVWVRYVVHWLSTWVDQSTSHINLRQVCSHCPSLWSIQPCFQLHTKVPNHIAITAGTILTYFECFYLQTYCCVFEVIIIIHL